MTTKAQLKAIKKYKDKLRKNGGLYRFDVELYESKDKELINKLKYLAKKRQKRKWIINALYEKLNCDKTYKL